MTRPARLLSALALAGALVFPALASTPRTEAQTLPRIVGGSGVDPAVEDCGTDDACLRHVLEGRGRLTIEEAMRLFAVYQRIGDRAAACRLAHVLAESPILPAPEQLIVRQYVSLDCR
jgi:hypothetical protein